MADQTPEQKRYHGDVRTAAETFEKEAKKVAPHTSENRTTTSTEGKVETTTKEK